MFILQKDEQYLLSCFIKYMLVEVINEGKPSSLTYGKPRLTSCLPHIQSAVNHVPHVADKYSDGTGCHYNTYHFTSGTGIPSTSTVNVIL
jgi:hypothetical protein